MPESLVYSRLPSNKHKPMMTQEVDITKPTISSNLQPFKQKVLSGNGFVHYK